MSGYCGLGTGSGSRPGRRVHCWLCRSRSSGWTGFFVLYELLHEVRDCFGQFLSRSFVCEVNSRLLRHKVTEHRHGVDRCCTWVASWLSAGISARKSSFCFVVFSISSDKVMRRSSIDTVGAAALACGASRSPQTEASSMVNCATFAESCSICSDFCCVAAG